jgi:rubrerythrin
MNNKTTLGFNRTGLATSPNMGPEMLRGAEMFGADPAGTGGELNRVRANYIQEAPLFGSMPPPASLKEAGVTALQMLKGNKALVLMDKLSSRLAFERTGSRLYETLLVRLQAGPTWEGGPSVEEVTAIHADELQHFRLVRQCIEQLGGDPTVMSPAADVNAVASQGLIQVLGDPRIPLRYALEGILIAELTDNDGWSMLIEVASTLGQDEMAEEFRQALAAEDEHLAHVRRWLRNASSADASMGLSEQPGEDRDAAPISIH